MAVESSFDTDMTDFDAKTLASTPLAKTPATGSASSLSEIKTAMDKLARTDTTSSDGDDTEETDRTLNSSPAESDSNSFSGFSDTLLLAKLKNAASASAVSISSMSGLTLPSHKAFGKLIHKHEVPRKVFHSSIGFLTLWLYTKGVVLAQVTPVLAALFVILTTTDYVRFRNETLNKYYCKMLGPLMREKEVNTYNGVIWYLLGLIIVFSLFPKDISLLSVLLLSWSDTAASTFGRAYGHLTPKFGRKSLAGSIASFMMGVISAVLIYKYYIPKYNYVNVPGDIMWSEDTSNIGFPLLVLLIGLVGAISEAIDVYDIDDNFTIPVLSAFFIYGVLTLGKKA